MQPVPPKKLHLVIRDGHLRFYPPVTRRPHQDHLHRFQGSFYCTGFPHTPKRPLNSVSPHTLSLYLSQPACEVLKKFSNSIVCEFHPPWLAGYRLKSRASSHESSMIVPLLGTSYRLSQGSSCPGIAIISW